VLFDRGLFDDRVAGNAVDPLVLGGIEYAVLEFAPPLLLVLGHERCGAVAAAVEALERGTTPPGHVAAVVEALREPVESVRHEPGDRVENAVRANIHQVRSCSRAAPSSATRTPPAGSRSAARATTWTRHVSR
jgi:carbonic anhydrase